MKTSTITVIIDDIHYSLKPSDIGAMHNMPAAHRQQLLSLLAPLKQIHQHDIAKASTNKAKASNTPNTALAQTSARPATSRQAHSSELNRAGRQSPNSNIGAQQPTLSKEEAANRVAQLMLAEKAKQKPPLDKKILYFWILAIAAVLFLMMAML